MTPFQKIKGTNDILPEEAVYWHYIEQTVREVMQLYGYGEIRTPIFEATGLFARGIGQLTDIVAKEMYTFEDRGKKSITLKPEGTAPVIRAFIEHALGVKRPVNKLFYIAPMFRQENPQAGRFRQFHQFGAELIGSPEPIADVETIALALEIYRRLGLRSFVVKLNSLGDETSRGHYKKMLQDYLRPHLRELCQTCQDRFDKNPLRLLDCKEATCQQLTSTAPRLIDHLDDASASHFAAVRALLDGLGIAYELDHRLVRGLDYYTRTAYEIISDDLGAQSALGGGGRYDLLTEELGGKPTPAVGFAAGIERLLMVLVKQQVLPALKQGVDIFIASLGERAAQWVAKLAHDLRQQNVAVEIDLLGRSLKAQLKEANRSGARYALIVGDQELDSGRLALRDLAQSEQQEIAMQNVVAELVAMCRTAAQAD